VKGYESGELTFLVEACYTIIAARDVLKWSHPLQFYEGQNFPNEIKNLYETIWQADLDRYTNQLQGYVFEVDMNQHLDPDNRDKLPFYKFRDEVISLDKAIRGYIDNLCEGLEKWQNEK